MDDPKSRQAAAPAAVPQLITLTPEQFAALAGKSRDTDEDLRKQAQFNAEAHEKRVNPSNKHHPGISVYSNPRGEVADPKPKLKCQLYWVGIETTADTMTPEEIRLVNELQVGDYPFTRTDGTMDIFHVLAETNAKGVPTKMITKFTSSGEARHTTPSMVAMLREVLGKNQAEADLRAENERLRALVGAR